jgi:hypothetical protein
MSNTRRVGWAGPLLILLAGSTNDDVAARYAADGSLIVPTTYREWVFMSSGLDMSYTDEAAMSGASMFDNVFVDPAAWATFQKSGHWPDKTVFVMESRGAESKGSINKRGHYQSTELMGLEFHVRDESRYKGGWAFFASDGGSAAKLLPQSAPCYTCHLAHGAVDTTFTQFYPTAKGIALKAGSYRER